MIYLSRNMTVLLKFWNSKHTRTASVSSRTVFLKINTFIIQQGSLEVNPSVLIVFFLIGISPYGPFPWKLHRRCIFCFRKAANSKQAWPECHIINYLLTWLAREVLRNIGPRLSLYGPRCARFVLPRPRANIPSSRSTRVRGPQSKSRTEFFGFDRIEGENENGLLTVRTEKTRFVRSFLYLYCVSGVFVNDFYSPGTGSNV